MAKRDLTFVSMIEIFFKGIKYYFLNFEKFMKYLAFPVFGQVAGITIICGLSLHDFDSETHPVSADF